MFQLREGNLKVGKYREVKHLGKKSELQTDKHKQISFVNKKGNKITHGKRGNIIELI